MTNATSAKAAKKPSSTYWGLAISLLNANTSPVIITFANTYTTRSQHYGLQNGDNWFRHEPTDVSMNDKCEIIYDQCITTTRPIGANRPDIIIKDKTQKRAYIIDVACPVDTNVGKKEREKVGKYGGLRAELERMWGVNAEIIPVIIGGLGPVTKNLGDCLTKIPGQPDQYMCQKICLLGSKRILQDVLKRS